MRALALPRRPLFSWLSVSVPFAAAYWFVAASLVQQWADDPNYAHGFFVPLMAAALAWRRRARLLATPRRFDPSGPALFALGGLLYLLGLATAELFTQRTSMLVVFYGLVLALEGRGRFRALAFPLLFLLAMVPIPYVFYYGLTFPLQVESSRLAAAFLTGAGMPLVREGNVIHLEGYSLEVVTACSGLRSIMTLGTMAVFASDFLRLGRAWKCVFVATAIPIAVAANVIRLVITAGVAAISGPESAESFLHDLSGLVVFVSGVAALGACGKGLEWLTRARR
jgi:exosortase